MKNERGRASRLVFRRWKYGEVNHGETEAARLPFRRCRGINWTAINPRERELVLADVTLQMTHHCATRTIH